MKKAIYVTQPTLASLTDFTKELEGVWERGILTHNGPLVKKLEKSLIQKLEVNNLSLVSNGTIALQIAIKALELKGDIITTPFTWVATLSAIQWEGCTPVFCDIDPETLNIDPRQIEKMITPDTVAIMPVHVFGNPCDVIAIEKIANKHNLKVIYDAAHAMGSTINDQSVLNYGDISATSLHATKLFNTGEGGACITKSDEINEKINRIRFFGHNESKEIVEEGFNGKLTEIHAALGLSNFTLWDKVLNDRKMKYHYYLNGLSHCKELRFQKTEIGQSNYSYFPIIIESEKMLEILAKTLSNFGIYPRRYFYPSVNTLNNIVPYTEMKVSESIANRILCLPLYYNLTFEEIDEIINIISKCLKKF